MWKIQNLLEDLIIIQVLYMTHFQREPEAAAVSPLSWEEKPRQEARAALPLPLGLPSMLPALPAHGVMNPLHPHTVTALCLPVCCLFHPPFTEFPTRSEPCHKQRQAETPSLPQEVSSLKFRRVTEQRGSSGGKTGIITRRLLAAQLSRSGHLQA